MYWFHFWYSGVRCIKFSHAMKTALTSDRTLGTALYYGNFLEWKQGSWGPALWGSSCWVSDLLVWSLSHLKAENHSDVSAGVWGSVCASLNIALTTCLMQKVDIRGTVPSVNSIAHRWKVWVSGEKCGGVTCSRM